MVAGGRELIDTLWNVNTRPLLVLLPGTGINRYIMECKWFLCSLPILVSGNELIDTLWNVNGEGIRRWSDGERELIDTLWNVNTRLTYCSINYLSAN